jgi:hypothetical protein
MIWIKPRNRIIQQWQKLASHLFWIFKEAFGISLGNYLREEIHPLAYIRRLKATLVEVGPLQPVL